MAEELKPIRDLGTMKVLLDNEIPIDYVVVKKDGQAYSTPFNQAKKGIAKLQLIPTQGIGKQNNVWIKGFLAEKTGHLALKKPISFELNIYVKKGPISNDRNFQSNGQKSIYNDW